jgi:hypothetical protein
VLLDEPDSSHGNDLIDGHDVDEPMRRKPVELLDPNSSVGRKLIHDGLDLCEIEIAADSYLSARFDDNVLQAVDTLGCIPLVDEVEAVENGLPLTGDVRNI